MQIGNGQQIILNIQQWACYKSNAKFVSATHHNKHILKTTNGSKSAEQLLYNGQRYCKHKHVERKTSHCLSNYTRIHLRVYLLWATRVATCAIYNDGDVNAVTSRNTHYTVCDICATWLYLNLPNILLTDRLRDLEVGGILQLENVGLPTLSGGLVIGPPGVSANVHSWISHDAVAKPVNAFSI